MNVSTVKRLQRDMQELGLYEGEVDGIWGSQSQAAWDATVGAARAREEVNIPPQAPRKQLSIAWSAKVSQTFVDRVIWIRDALGMPEQGADWIMACIAWESAEQFSPSVKNMAGSGATGLIQFMPKTAAGLGTSTQALARMTAEDQLNYVYRYFLPYKGRLNSLSDVYMAILWPAGIGKPLDWALWDKGTRPTTYRQNAGLDINRDGVITKREAAAKVQAKLEKGLKPENRRALA